MKEHTYGSPTPQLLPENPHKLLKATGLHQVSPGQRSYLENACMLNRAFKINFYSH